MTFTHTQHVSTYILTMWKLSVLWTCIGEFEHLFTCSSVICINFSAAWPFVSVSYTVFLLNCYYFLFNYKSSKFQGNCEGRCDILTFGIFFFKDFAFALFAILYVLIYESFLSWLLGFVSCFRILVVYIQV